LGFKNKDMKVTDLPAFKSISLTPAHFADLGFTWKDDYTLIVSRVKESEWSNEAKQRPDPSLFTIKIGEQAQTQISFPSKSYGDYRPIFLPSTNKLTWLRKKDLAGTQRNLWISGPNVENARVWIKNVGEYDFFEQK
ncbi:MAG: TolB domain-containing protein, partial [Bacillus sp. (in: firmicutes)]